MKSNPTDSRSGFHGPDARRLIGGEKMNQRIVSEGLKRRAARRRNRRAIAVGTALTVAALGAGHKQVDNAVTGAVNYVFSEGSTRPDIMPDKGDPKFKEKIDEGIKDGKFTTLMTDSEHPTLSHLAEATDADHLGVLTDDLTAEMGTDQLPLGRVVYAPNTPGARKLHDQQFPPNQP